MRVSTRSDVAETRLRAALGRRESDQRPRSLLDVADDLAVDVPPAVVAVATPAPGASLLAALPSAVRSGVLDPRRKGALALCLLALIGALAAGALALRARPHASVVQRPVPQVVSATPATAAPSKPTVLVVDVAGEVQRPGLQRLPVGSRVADAVAAAGGEKRGASTAGLNLARKLIDGEQVVVGGAHPTAAASIGAPRGAGQPLDLNGASLSDLDQLSGVGPVLAQRIIAWRNEHGGFTTVDQLREVEGIGERKFASLRAQVTL